MTEETERYGFVAAWSRELGIPRGTIARRLKKHGVKGIAAKTQRGRILVAYAEEDIRRICGDLLFNTLDEAKAALQKEAARFGMTLDQFVRPENLAKSTVFRAAMRWSEENIPKRPR